MQSAYKVEVEKAPCDHCGSGGYWVVVDPEGVAGSTSYGDQAEAEEIAELQNAAWESGFNSGLKEAESRRGVE